jgi:hypothetical protein
MTNFLTARRKATITRFVRILAFSVAVIVLEGLVTFFTNNALGLEPTSQSLVMLIVVPALAAADKWARWNEAQ